MGLCTEFPRPGQISGCLLQPQTVFKHSSDVLQCAATSQDSGLVFTACIFSFSSLAINPVCPHGGCLGLVHSRSGTEVLEGGGDCAGTSHIVLFLFCGAEPAWGVPVGMGTDWKSQFCHWTEVQVKERTDAGCLEVISRSLGSESPV